MDMGEAKNMPVRYHRTIRQQYDKFLWDKIGLELVQINVKRTIEMKSSSNGRDNLGNHVVKVGEARLRNVKLPLANVVNCLIVNLCITN